MMKAPEDGISDIMKGQWQWKSNQHPRAGLEELQSESYPSEDNDIIEEAYQNQQKEVDLGGHIISIKEMSQIRKGEKGAQRRVRRIDSKENEERTYRNERYYQIESPKIMNIMNRIFGNLEDFLGFFRGRSYESLRFSKLFNEIERRDDLKRLNQEIVPLIFECLQKELEKEGKKHSDPHSPKKRTKDEEKLLLLFQKEFASFVEFYGEILKAYTMSTFLYRNLNEYLREENWTEIEDLLPYTVCLCQTFFKSNQAKPSSGEDEEGKSIFELYRGVWLTEAAIKNFDLKKNSLFSWYSVTSTSKLERVARKFLEINSCKGETKKYKVMFVVKVPITNHKKLKYSTHLDIREYSVFPKEEEVILPPGCIFELEGVTKDAEEITRITIRLKDDIQSLAGQGIIMFGTIQNRLMTEKQARVLILEGEELCTALKLIFGNKLIEEIEIGLCTFDNNSLVLLIRMLQTVKNLKRLKFISCSYKNEGEISDVKICPDHFKTLTITILESNNFSKIFGQTSNFSYFGKCFQAQEISLMSFDHFSDFQELLNLTHLRSLKLNFSRFVAIKDEAMSHFCSRGLKSLTQLVFLDLNFEQCNQITHEAINTLSLECLKYLTQLISLSLNFAKCSKLTDQGLSYLFDNNLINLTQLKSLSLSFAFCTEITNKGMSSLVDATGLKCFTRLTSLQLNFSGCSKITNEGVNNLITRWLKFLAQLTSLKLDMSKCIKLTNDVFNSFCNLQRLTSLNINFSDCKQITAEGVKNLFSERLKNLTELISLKRNLSGCSILKSEEAIRFCSEKIKHLANLTNWRLKISHDKKKRKTEETNQDSNQNDDAEAATCNKMFLIEPPAKFLFRRIENLDEKSFSKPAIMDSARDCVLKKIAKTRSLSRIIESRNEESIFKALKNLEYSNQLLSLSLRFSQCKLVSDKLLDKLCSQEFKSLIHLIHLKLDFAGCSQISNEALKKLSLKCFGNFSNLKLFDLNFSQCLKITDEGVKYLSSEGLHLPHLVSLRLNFEGCEKITNQGIYYLSPLALRYLRQLKDLDLNFSNCRRITEEGLNDLYCFGLRCIPHLRSLKLNFVLCSTMEGKVINNLCGVLQNFRSLRSLTINYFLCAKITDDVVANFCSQGLAHLGGLTSLSLNFSYSEITDKGIKNLCSEGLRCLFQLEYFSLNCEGSKLISDEGVSNLCNQVFQHLVKLKILALNFTLCPKITDSTKRNLPKILPHFRSTFTN